MQKFLPMFEPLASTISPSLIFSSGDSHARTFPTPENARAWLLASVLVFGSSSPELLAKFDPVLCCWKMSRQLPRQEKKKMGNFHRPIWQWLLIRWPAWGTAHGGELSRLLMPALPTNAIDGFVWPTPNAEDFYIRQIPPKDQTHVTASGTLKLDTGHKSYVRLSQTVMYYENKKDWHTPIATDALRTGDIELKRDNGLSAQVRWATPKARDAKGSSGELFHNSCLPLQLGDKGVKKEAAMNPQWVEMLMGFPPNWTALD